MYGGVGKVCVGGGGGGSKLLYISYIYINKVLGLRSVQLDHFFCKENTFKTRPHLENVLPTSLMYAFCISFRVANHLS